MLAKDINNLAEVTNAILQPEPRNGLETVLHVCPNLAANLMNIYHPAQGALTAAPTVASWSQPDAVPLQRDPGRQPDGLPGIPLNCARNTLAPDPRRDQVQHPPSGVNQFHGRHPAEVPLLFGTAPAAAPGYKDTTVPGIWSRDTLFSHGNHEQGWTVAPGMQGVDVQPFTANMLTPIHSPR